MANTVDITVDAANGDITYSPSVLHVRRSAKVTWRARHKPFTLVFPQSPFGDGTATLRSDGNDITSPAIASDAGGIYHYMVAVAADARKTRGRKKAASFIFLDAGCPEIIVGR